MRDQGLSVRDAVLEASVIQLRPILMTGLSTSLGALPLVLASGAGAEARESIGVVVLSGGDARDVDDAARRARVLLVVGRFTGSPEQRARELETQLAVDAPAETAA